MCINYYDIISVFYLLVLYYNITLINSNKNKLVKCLCGQLYNCLSIIKKINEKNEYF